MQKSTFSSKVYVASLNAWARSCSVVAIAIKSQRVCPYTY